MYEKDIILPSLPFPSAALVPPPLPLPLHLLPQGPHRPTEGVGHVQVTIRGEPDVPATTAQTVNPRPEVTSGRGSKRPGEEAIPLRRSAPPPESNLTCPA